MPVSSTTRRTTVVRPQTTRSTSTVSRTSSRTAVGHSSRSSFSRSRAATSDRANLAGYRGRGRTTAASQTERRGLGSSTGTLRRGMENQTVRRLQERLTASGFDVGPADGKFGPRTQAAVRDFQRAQGLRADGVVGRRTFSALNQSGVGSRTGDTFTPGAGATDRTRPTPSGSGTNGVARLDRVNRGPGMSTGTITVNGNTYQFNSGSSRLYSTPTGEFRVTAHRNSRSDAGFTRDGVGFSFRMEDPRRPGSDRFYDPRAGRDRTALRIHPDGGARGTAGCIGIVGDAATLRRFREDMNAELRRNGGSYTLRVN